MIEKTEDTSMTVFALYCIFLNVTHEPSVHISNWTKGMLLDLNDPGSLSV